VLDDVHTAKVEAYVAYRRLDGLRAAECGVWAAPGDFLTDGSAAARVPLPACWELAEIRASDLAFSTAEADLLLARHGGTLTAGQLECLIRRTEGWAAGLRLAAVSLDAHPNPDQFLKEVAAEDSTLTG
jgi:hypothetical protein